MAQPEMVYRSLGWDAGPDASHVLPYCYAFTSLHNPDPTHQIARLSKGLASPQCSTAPLNSCHQALPVPRAGSSSPVNSMQWLPPSESVRAVVGLALPGVSVESIRPLPSSRPLRDVFVSVSDGRNLILTLPSSPLLRLLRSEQWLVLSEALIIPWIARTASEQAPRDTRVSIQYLLSAGSYEGDSSRPASIGQDATQHQSPGQALARRLPVLIAHSPSCPELGTAFNLIEPTRGYPILSLREPLAAIERKSAGFQKGQLVRQISALRSPNYKFGPVVAVLSPSYAPAGPGNTGTSDGSGVESWGTAFLAMVEGILRDGEDLAVMMSYSLIRHHMQRLGHLLNAVTQPRLVVLDAGDDANVLVSLSEADGPGGMETRTISVTGLRDWSNCIFGDPLMTSIFCEDDNADFLDGFQTPQPPSPTMGDAGSPQGTPGESIIEDHENAHVRLMLYECYHAAVCVVKHFHRPAGPNGTRREMEARRRLASVLNRLAVIDEEVMSKRPRTVSVDIWPAKKPKPGGGA